MIAYQTTGFSLNSIQRCLLRCLLAAVSGFQLGKTIIYFPVQLSESLSHLKGSGCRDLFSGNSGIGVFPHAGELWIGYNQSLETFHRGMRYPHCAGIDLP